MTTIDKTFVPEFQRDVKRLLKKYRHLEDDLKLAEQVLTTQPINRLSVQISNLGSGVALPIYTTNTITTMDIMKCEKCGYEWKPRVANPKECPECKTRLKLKEKVK